LDWATREAPDRIAISQAQIPIPSPADACYLAFYPIAYAGLLAALGARSGGSGLDRVRFALVLATMHYGWGAGFVKGVLRGARDTVDTSRIAAQPSQPSA